MRALGPNCQALVDESKPGCCVACDTFVPPKKLKYRKRKSRATKVHRWTLCRGDADCRAVLQHAMELDAKHAARERKLGRMR